MSPWEVGPMLPCSKPRAQAGHIVCLHVWMHAPVAPVVSTHSLRVALEPPERARYWSRVLDVSEAELRSLVGEVGPRAHRVCARLWELRQPGAQGGRPT
jgi:hypothetical protein